MQPEIVDAHLEDLKSAAREYDRLSDIGRWDPKDENLDILKARARLRTAAKAWAQAERALQALTCPPPVPMLGRKLPWVDDGSPEVA